jgi:cytochrome c oxidase cbb3-type subunit I/II
MSTTTATSTPTGALEKFHYDDGIVKKFVVVTLVWAAVAFLLGVLVALQLSDWRLNFDLPWLTYGRLRPLHTNAAIFAFAGNAIFAGIYYSTQRLLKSRMFSDRLSNIHFWGWQAIIVAAAITLPMGISVSKEYAELEWPIDLAIAGIWVVFAINFFGTIFKRREKHMYVAIWFYIATIVTVALLHIVNSINIPVTLWKSYPVFAGAQDALVQWWYGHNAVAFFLTTPFLGLMYYYLPKAANRPVYSYRLSIVHFWSLVFIYIWAGPHHLLYTALPDWAQTLGMLFSVMLLAPSWGGMINGLLTLRGAWDKVRVDPILKMFVAALTFYGMSTFEGPLLSIKSVNLLGHYTDWIIGHVHGGTLGWNGFMSFAMIYWLVPKLWRTKLYSVQLANWHFWTGLLGTLTYYISMVSAGITQGLMLRAIDSTGRLQYPDFIETVTKIVPLYWVRALAGVLYLGGFLLMAYNIWMTVRSAPAEQKDEEAVAPKLLVGSSAVSATVDKFHRQLEGMGGAFTALTVVSVMIGGAIEIIPTWFVGGYLQAPPGVTPYSALQLHGRDIYVREGCYTCHSQMVRPIPAETLRYGAYSRAEESAYDRPFQWGSKRTGPDLARLGGKYPDLWHFRHMLNPRDVVAGSLMPSYPWLFEDKTDFKVIGKKLAVMKQLGVPYSEEQVAKASFDARAEAERIAAGLSEQGAPPKVADKEIIALIAYLQKLGADFQKGGIQ